MNQDQSRAIEIESACAEDKRLSVRMPVPLPMQMYSAEGDSLLGEVVNFSLAGLMFRAGDWIEPGTACRAELKLPNRSEQVVCSLQVSVVWCEAGSAPDCYWVGCRILDLPFFTRAWLNQILSR